MVQIKNSKELEGHIRPWPKLVRGIVIFSVAVALFGFLILQANQKEEITTPKYKVVVSNSIGHHTYYCESYEKVDNTYQLFNSVDSLINEITITDGYLVEIKLSK